VSIPLTGGSWRVGLSTDAAKYGGEGRSGIASGLATLSPRSALFLRVGTA
jgi:hypothetical protein